MQDLVGVENPSQSLKELAPRKPTDEPAQELPRKFGRLTLLKAIARGGMGEVFLATAGGIEGAERPCVVKIIRREHAEDPSFLARFFDEARIQAQLDHPGVAKVLEAATDPEGKPFVVVEYIEGRNLAEVRNRGSQLNANIGWAEAIAVGVAMSDALTHVHERTDSNGQPLGIVHRDLSPQNVMLGYGGDVKLIDFGTARGENRRCQTVSGVVLAKPGYVAPEVANSQPGGVAADVYALGIMVWELCAGRRFLSGDPSAHVALVASGRRNPPPLAELIKAPPELDTVLARLTAPRVEDRFASAREANAELVRLLKKAPSLANGERGVRPRIASVLERLYPAEPARSRADLGRLLAVARNVEPKHELTGTLSPAPAVADDSLFPGTRYRILREIGRGAMGVVYEAHHVDLGRIVALKVLPKERCKSPEHENRFRREARSIARLRHPNLVQLHDFGVSSDGRPYYAMERLEGETLEQYLVRERGMDFRESARVGMETCSALEAAHGAGLVHRDVKPGNIFLTREGQIKLLDFGVVQVAPEEASSDPEGLRLTGTIEYMAPEQAAGEATDERADVYAVGAVLYELITGRLPHVADTTIALIDRKLRCVPESPRERSPGRGIPASLDRVVMRALRRFPEQRYQSAADLRVAIEAVVEKPEHARRIRRRIAASMLLASACGLGLFVFKSARRPEVRARAMAMLGPSASRFLGNGPVPIEAPPEAVLYEAPKTVNDVAAPNAASPKAPESDPGDVDPAAKDVKTPPSPSPAQVDTTTPEVPTDASFEDALARADAHLKKADYLQALNAYRALGKKHPTDARVLKGWADAAVKTKGWGEALRVAVKWASADSSPDAQIYLARIQRSTGQRYGAVATLTRLLDQYPDQQVARDLLDRCVDHKLASR